MRKVLVLIVLLAGCRSTATAPNNDQSDLRFAFNHDWVIDEEEYPTDFTALGGKEFVESERWKNFQEQAKDCPSVAEVIKVELGKTTDSNEWVIRMYGPSYRYSFGHPSTGVCSLWLRGSDIDKTLDVRSFSPY